MQGERRGGGGRKKEKRERLTPAAADSLDEVSASANGDVSREWRHVGGGREGEGGGRGERLVSANKYVACVLAEKEMRIIGTLGAVRKTKRNVERGKEGDAF